MNTLRPVIAGGLLGLVLFTLPAAAQDPDMEDYLASIVHNTVRVEAAGQSGFGIIVGLRGSDLLIATARHTLGTGWEVEPEICFPPRGDVCSAASVAYLADPVGNQPRLDLAVLAVPDPGGIAWRPNIEAAAEVGDEVWVIGRSLAWWISPTPGRVVGFDPDSRHVRYRDLDVAPGVSGAPIISRDGLVAMHLQATDEGHGLELAAIRERVTQRTRGKWILRPPSDCGGIGTAPRELAGRTFVVHIDPARPEPALDAMTRLLCAGIRAMPRTVPDAAAWERDRVVYRSGDLRAARVIQRLLAPVAPLDAALGQPRGDLDIWLR